MADDNVKNENTDKPETSMVRSGEDNKGKGRFAPTYKHRPPDLRIIFCGKKLFNVKL